MTLTFMTIPQAAASLGLAASTLRHQIRREKLAAHKIGRDWYVTVGEVERYRKDNKKETAA
jgi:excisionase family DNA binding protein